VLAHGSRVRATSLPPGDAASVVKSGLAAGARDLLLA